MIQRERYLDQIKPFLDRPVVKVITGMRRVGKSTLLGQIRDLLRARGVPEECIVHINKDLLAWDHIRTYHDLDSEVGKMLRGGTGRRYILIDEVQEITEWERAVTSFLAEGLGDIIITGSNANLLSSELSTRLTGRYVEIKMLPLGLHEFVAFRTDGSKRGGNDDYRNQDPFGLYLRYGGMPGIHHVELQDEQVFPYLEAILNTLLLKDVVRRNEVRDVHNLERILAFVFDNIGSLVSARKIASFFKGQGISISVDTVSAYLGYLTQALLVERVGRFAIKGKKHLEYLDKYYVTDVGLRHGLFGYREGNIAGLLENVVYLELRRRGYTVYVGRLDGVEIDFVAERHDMRIYVQVTYLLADESTVAREFGNLEKIADNYPKFVLSLDEFFPAERNGIRHLNIRDFLLNEDQLF